MPSPHVAVCTLRGRHCTYLYHYLLFLIIIHLWAVPTSHVAFVHYGCGFILYLNHSKLFCFKCRGWGVLCLKCAFFCDRILEKEKGFYMKKLVRKINFAVFSLMVTMSASMAASSSANQALCELAEKFGYIFGIIRTLAFVGAGISIAGWAWGYISGGKAIDPTAEVKNKGIPMLIGFILLFGIGTVLSIFMSMAQPGGELDCIETFFK